MNYKRILFLTFAVPTIISMVGCGGNNAPESDQLSDADSSATQSVSDLQKAQTILHSLPSPIETALLLRKAGASYNKDILNPIENVSKYTSTYQRAVNLGIYGTDLSYTSVFDQTQESMLYLRCASQLANDLGVGSAFGDRTVSRLDANKDNRDSIMTIISDAFLIADTYLKENERPATSAMIIAGGWVEGLYIACSIARTTKNPELVQRIGEQKLSLNNIMEMLNGYTNDESVKLMAEQVGKLQPVFESIQVASAKAEAKSNDDDSMTLGSSAPKTTLTPEQLKSLQEKVFEVRNNMIK